MRNTCFVASLGAAVCATCLITGPADASTAPSTPSSLAFAVSMNCYYPQDSNPADNFPVGIYPVLPITGTTAPYRHAIRRPVGYTTAAWNGPVIGPGGTSYGEINFNFVTFFDLVTGNSLGVDMAKASVGRSNITILGNPSGSPALLSIDLTGGAITARASGPAGGRKYTEAGNTTGITLSGTLIGPPISAPPGQLKANTILFDNGAMQIIANATASTAAGLEVLGLEIVMAGQNLNGTSMTGTVKFLDSQVQ